MPERPLSRAETRALDAIESGFVFEHRTRHRRRNAVLLAVGVAALAVIALFAPTAAFTLVAFVAVAFAGPVMVALFLRVAQIDNTHPEKRRRLTVGRSARLR
jgi:hypothetical protein